MRTVIFDLDGTITRKDTYLPFLYNCVRKSGLRPSAALLPLYALLNLLGIIGNERLKEVFLDKTLSGVRAGNLDGVIDGFIERLLETGLNRDVIAILNAHLRENDSVIMATASFDIYTRRLAERLGIKNVICTRAEIRNGIITGRLLGRNCRGEEKLKRLEEAVTEEQWKDSIFYTDHHSDLPVLKKVSRGFLVRPGLRTRLLLRRFNFDRI